MLGPRPHPRPAVALRAEHSEGAEEPVARQLPLQPRRLHRRGGPGQLRDAHDAGRPAPRGLAGPGGRGRDPLLLPGDLDRGQKLPGARAVFPPSSRDIMLGSWDAVRVDPPIPFQANACAAVSLIPARRLLYPRLGRIPTTFVRVTACRAFGARPRLLRPDWSELVQGAPFTQRGCYPGRLGRA